MLDWNDAKQKYGDLAEVELAFAKAYQIRDRVWAEIPSLAQWVAWQEESLAAQPPADAAKSPGETVEPKKKIMLLIESVQQLDGALSRAEQTSRADLGRMLIPVAPLSNGCGHGTRN